MGAFGFLGALAAGFAALAGAGVLAAGTLWRASVSSKRRGVRGVLVNSGTLALDMDKRPGGQGNAPAGGYSGRAVGGHAISLPSRSSVSLPGGSVVRSVPGVSQHPMIQMRPVVRPNALPASRQQIATVRPQIPGIQPPTASFRPRVSTFRPQVQPLTPNRQAVQSGGLPPGVTYAGLGNPLPVGVTYANPGHLTAGSINHNFRNGLNWSTDRHHWGYNPWWNRSAVHPWYGGFWNCGWNNDYYHHLCRIGLGPWPGYACCVDDDYGYCPTSGWGLCGWGLGNLLYDSGYLSYCNPYFAAPVPIAGGDQVGYTEPLASVAVRTTPNDGDVSKMTGESESWVGQSQAAFKQRDYLRALELADKAVAAAPGDGALHEYRALVLFALGNYAEAAGVLNPVLAGGPGWNWTTMIALYDSRRTYASQLESLEGYAKAKPRAADIHFLLGYHYMVGGKIAMANGEFALAAKLQPADTVSAQLRDLTNASINGGGDKPTASDVVPVPPPAPLSVQKLEGTWIADKGAQGTVTLILKDGGKFVWTFDNAGHSNDFSGDYNISPNGLLVLDAKLSRMVG